jgi:hypothetical protein
VAEDDKKAKSPDESKKHGGKKGKNNRAHRDRVTSPVTVERE